MFKKSLALFLSAILLLTLAACGSAPEQGVPGTDETFAEAHTNTTAPAETLPTISFEEQVLIDNEVCTFKIIAIEEDNLWGYSLKAYLENKTELELMFSLRDVSVNGFMCDPFWSATVTPGMKSNESISFLSESFDRNGIESVTEITFTLDVYDSKDWTADHLVTEIFSVYPMGEEAVVPYVRVPQNGEIVLFENDSCAMIVKGYDPDNLFGYAVNVYLENKTDKTLMFSISDASVNGFMCDPFWAESIAPGKRSNTAITWMSTSLEENSITEVESLTLPIRVYDADDFMATELVNETFTLTP